MKINRSSSIGPIAPPATEARTPDRAPEIRPGTSVSLSGDARWIASVADEARRAPAVRADVVHRTRQAVESGTWDRSVDLDQVVDRLLADL